MNAQTAVKQLKFKSISSIARILVLKFPNRRQDKIKNSTPLTAAEIQVLKDFKSQKRFINQQG